MDNNEFSFESIFAAGMGMPVEKTVEVQSEERFDGFLDATFAEISRSEEDIQFLETYGSMEDFNTKTKLNMLSKINKAYGKCNRGIENYCRSLEAETDGTAAVKEDEKPAEEGKTADPKTTEKKKNWFKKIIETVIGFFKKIWDAIKRIGSMIKAKITQIVEKIKRHNVANDLSSTSKKVEKGKELKEDNKFSKMSKEDITKLADTVKKLVTDTDKLQGTVNKVIAKANEAIKFVDKLSTSETDSYGNIMVKSISAQIQMLSKIGNALMKGCTLIFRNITNCKVVGPYRFDVFNGFYTTFCVKVVTLTDDVMTVVKAQAKNKSPKEKILKRIQENSLKLLKHVFTLEEKLDLSMSTNFDTDSLEACLSKCVSAVAEAVNDDWIKNVLCAKLIGIKVDESASPNK